MTNTSDTAILWNITASGDSLRALLEEHTGCDPVLEPSFAWSNTLPCDDCDVHDSTAKVIIDDDGVTAVRLCFHCYADVMTA